MEQWDEVRTALVFHGQRERRKRENDGDAGKIALHIASDTAGNDAIHDWSDTADPETAQITGSQTTRPPFNSIMNNSTDALLLAVMARLIRVESMVCSLSILNMKHMTGDNVDEYR